jgi:branched-chain amino acid transport system substrate-binding protein
MGWIRTACAGLAALLAFAVPMTTPVRADEPKPVRIGAIIEMSGPLAAYGQEVWGLLKYTVDKINAEGGIKRMGGAKIELVLADDASLPSRAANEARRLITEEHVAMLTGGLLTPEMQAVGPVLDELKVPTLAVLPAGSTSPYLFSLNFPYDRGYAKTMTDFLVWLRDVKGWKIKTVALLYTNYEAGQKVNEALQDRLPKAGFTVAGEVPMDPKANDQTAAMLRLKAMKADFTAGLVRPQEGALLNQARFALHIRGTIFMGGTGGFADAQLWHDLGDKIGEETLTHDLFGLAVFSPAMNYPSLRAMVADVNANAHLPNPAGAVGIGGAQAARIIQRILEATGSTDPAVLYKALQEVNIRYGDPDLYLVRPGGLHFGADRAPEDSSGVIVQWLADHSQQVVYPPQLATAEPRPLRN